MFRNEQLIKILLFVLILISFYTLFIKSSQFNTKKLSYSNVSITNCQQSLQSDVRDFTRYNCKNRKRIGGEQRFILGTSDPLWRIDGAWFVCYDFGLAPNENECNILSFGINTDDSFDVEMNEKYGCNLFSFDPIIENDRFAKIRNANQSLFNSFTLKVNSKWNFYRIGVVGDKEKIVNPNEIGGMQSLENILKITNLQDKVIDVFKMDIEYGEFDVLKHLNVDYACKYFKQFLLETHPTSHKDISFYHLLRKLDPCFLLFHRDTRFFEGDTFGPTGLLTEYQVIIAENFIYLKILLILILSE